MRLRWYGPEHSRSIAHSEAFVHGLASHTAKPSFMDFSSKKEEKKLHGLEKHHGGHQANPSATHRHINECSKCMPRWTALKHNRKGIHMIICGHAKPLPHPIIPPSGLGTIIIS